jgi:hypothetical protein
VIITCRIYISGIGTVGVEVGIKETRVPEHIGMCRAVGSTTRILGSCDERYMIFTFTRVCNQATGLEPERAVLD